MSNYSNELSNKSVMSKNPIPYMRTSSYCLHCEKTVLPNSRFCCTGCGIAYTFLHELNLEKYYEDVREIFQAKPQSVEIYNDYNYEEHINKNSSQLSITLHMPQIVCGACVWLIEKTLKKQFKNLQASINFANKALNLKWSENESLSFHQILEVINRLGYNAIPITVDEAYNEAKNQEKNMLKRIGISGLCSFFVMALSICIWAGEADGSMDNFTKYMFYLISLVIVVPALFYSADVFFIKAWQGVKNKYLDFSFSIAFAIFTTLAISIYNTFYSAFGIENSTIRHAYFESAISLVFILLLGKYLEMRIKNKAIYDCSRRYRMENVKYDIAPSQNSQNNIPYENIVKYPSQINANDIIIIKKGQTIPVDCTLVSEHAGIDTSILTGENMAQNFLRNSEIKAGSINLSSAIKVKAKRIYKESFLYKLQSEVEQTIATSKSSKLANKIANLFTPVILLCAIFTFAYWYYFNGASLFDALYITTTLLIVTCPCAIGIAIPLSSFAAINNLADNGIIVKNSSTLEEICKAQNIVFDKTGTLTTGQLKVELSQSMNVKELDVLFTMTELSSHPFSIAINNSLHGCKRLEYQNFTEAVSRGTKIEIDGKQYLFGKAAFVGEKISESTLFFKTPTTVYKIPYQDKLRENAKQMVDFFRAHKVKPWLISGDNWQNVREIASQLNITKKNIIANATPQDKFKKCCEIGNYIMVGDGLNDSIALKAARVSISHFEGADLSKYNSDIVFKGNDLLNIAKIYTTAKKFKVVVLQNFCCSLLYNALALPIAFFGYITPLFAAVFMAFSSICVILNSLRLK